MDNVASCMEAKIDAPKDPLGTARAAAAYRRQQRCIPTPVGNHHQAQVSIGYL